MSIQDDLNKVEESLRGLPGDKEINTLIEEAVEAARNNDFNEAFTLVDDISELYDKKYVQEASKIIQADDFQNLSNKVKAETIREGLSPVGSAGYDVSATAANRVIQEQNKVYGIAQAGLQPLMDEERFKSIIARAIDFALEDDFEEAMNTINGGFSVFSKQGNHDVQVLAAENDGEQWVTEFASVPEHDACSYCKQRSGYWTTDVEQAHNFHDFCRCVLISRRVLAE